MKWCLTINETLGQCSGNGECVFLDHKAEPVAGCRVGNPDCAAYCSCNTTATFAGNTTLGPWFGLACEFSNSTYFTRSGIRGEICQGFIDVNSLTTPSQTYLGEFLQNLADGLKPFEMRRAAREKCKEAVALAFGLIEDDTLFNGNSPDIDRENAVEILSLMTDAYLNPRLTDISKDTSSMLASAEDTSYLFDLAQILQNKIQGTMSKGAAPVEIVTDNLRIKTHYDVATSLEGTTLVPAFTDEMVEYGVNATEITLPASGFSRCSSDEYISFGIMEWGIMPVAFSNYSNIEEVEDSLVQLTIAMPDTAPTGAIARYNVSVNLQKAIDFNISYPYEGFNRTFPMLYTSDVNDGTSFVMQNCNATEWTNTTITFDCPDFGQLCTESEENSGYVQTIGDVDYMVNSFSGGKYFLQGKYTSAPTSMPTGQPSGAPTTVPSGEPTGQPTGQPTTQPTGQPSSQPTGEPTRMPVYPTGEPTGQPTTAPSGKPTSIPSAVPTTSPTSYPTSADPMIVVVDLTQHLLHSSLDAEKWEADPNYLMCFQMAVATVTGVRASRVTVGDVTTLIEGVRRKRRLMDSRRRLLPGDIMGVRVHYTIDVIADEIMDDDTKDWQDAWDHVSLALTESMSPVEGGLSGFGDAMVAAADYMDSASMVTLFQEAGVEMEGAITVLSANTDSPTSMPTEEPDRIAEDTLFGFPILEVIVPAVWLFLVGCAAFAYWWSTHARRHDLRTPIREHVKAHQEKLGIDEGEKPLTALEKRKQRRSLAASKEMWNRPSQGGQDGQPPDNAETSFFGLSYKAEAAPAVEINPIADAESAL